ncbi:ABC transporter ATP-binding protein/permease [Yinghuangia sp. ASG 101]|uniref:ATP-binding cassette domain-containing protein n=1 Tax=Yinghuangia sp. ASG 101 TaxID=2896848 RepID=UPI001E4D6502|nr:ABC transporter ATP-binding protein [Yinghuangia sp. ASG 101]UGQ13995.1 ABC transporter ATP-binding protein/permease [Yinghuangia sp. ASG 101]
MTPSRRDRAPSHGRHAARRDRTASGPGGIRAGRRLLVDELRPRKKALVRVLAWSALEGLPALLTGVLVAAALDRGFLAGQTGFGLAMLGVLAAAMLVRAAATYAMFPQLAAVVEPLRDALVRRVVGGALDTALAGRAAGAAAPSAAVARLTEQVEGCRNLTASLLRTLRQLVVTVVAALIGLALLAPVLLPLVLLTLVPAAWLFVRLLGPLARRRRALVLADERIADETGRIVAGLRDVVASGAQDRVCAELGASIDAQAAAVRALAKASALRLLVVGVGGQLPLIVLVSASPALVRHGMVSPGELAGAVLYLVKDLVPALRALTATVGDWILELGVVAGRLAEAGAVPGPARAAAGPRVPGAAGPGSVRAAEVAAAPKSAVRSGSVVLSVRDLAFAYGPFAAPVVDGLTVAVPEGGHLAVVGPSGIGKSTLAALLAGLVEPSRGAVALRGVPLTDLPEERVRREIAVVPQEAYVFAGTVRENLAYLLPEATDGELDRAVRLVGCRDLVTRLGGYDAALADPSELSAGERQLIALARVFVSPAEVVILDEATCHLDPATEALAEAAFSARAGVLIVIAHRMDSARRADRILVMDGNLPTVGTHDELLAGSPLYADLTGRWSLAPDAPA